MNIFNRINSKSLITAISFALNLLLALVIVVCVSTRPTKINVEDAYQKAYTYAREACVTEKDPGVDCNQLKLNKIDYQTIDNPQWVMSFIADNLNNSARWEGFFILNSKNNLIDSETIINHCKHIDGFDCQV